MSDTLPPTNKADGSGDDEFQGSLRSSLFCRNCKAMKASYAQGENQAQCVHVQWFLTVPTCYTPLTKRRKNAIYSETLFKNLSRNTVTLILTPACCAKAGAIYFSSWVVAPLSQTLETEWIDSKNLGENTYASYPQTMAPHKWTP